TLLWNCNKLSSRLMYSSGDSRVRFGGLAEPSDDGSVTGVGASGESFGSPACNSPIGEVCIEAPVPLGSCKKEPPFVQRNARNAASREFGDRLGCSPRDDAAPSKVHCRFAMDRQTSFLAAPCNVKAFVATEW